MLRTSRGLVVLRLTREAEAFVEARADVRFSAATPPPAGATRLRSDLVAAVYTTGAEIVAAVAASRAAIASASPGASQDEVVAQKE